MADRQMRCAVVGAGVIGIFCAHFLLKRGHRVTLFDRFPLPYQGTTAAGFGSLTPFSDPFFQGEISRFARDSVSLYREEIVPDLKAFGRVDLSSDSLLHLFDSEGDISACVKKLEKRGHSHQSDFRVLTTAETISQEPNLAPGFAGSIEYMEPWIDTSQLLPVLLSAVRAQAAFTEAFGCKIVEASETTQGVSLTDDAGTAHAFDSVVIASGGAISGLRGLPAPNLRLIRGDGALAVTQDGQPLVQRHLYKDNAFVTPRRNGEHLLGVSYESGPDGQDDALPAWDRASARASHLINILQGCTAVLPKLAVCEITKVWHGWRPATPSQIPYVGRVPGCSRVWTALGFIGLGVTLAPAVGLSLARTIEGEAWLIPAAFSSPQGELWRMP